MCVHALQSNGGCSCDALDFFERVFLGHPGATHAGVDFDVHGNGCHTLARDGVGEVGAGECYRESVAYDGRDLGFENRAQDEDLVLDAGVVEFHRFVDGGDAEDLHARVCRVRDLHGTMAVGVRLDREQDADVVAHPTLQVFEVAIEAVEVDLEPRW